MKRWDRVLTATMFVWVVCWFSVVVVVACLGERGVWVLLGVCVGGRGVRACVRA